MLRFRNMKIKKHPKIELYGDIRAATKTMPAIFGSHEKDPKNNNIKVLSHFINNKYCPS